MPVSDIIEKHIFVTTDGKEFQSKKDAGRHQIHIDVTASQIYSEYLESLKRNPERNYKLEYYGIWEVRGEHPDNGPMPFIGFVEGTFEQAVKWALKQPDFFTYGSGGIITGVEPIKL